MLCIVYVRQYHETFEPYFSETFHGQCIFFLGTESFSPQLILLGLLFSQPGEFIGDSRLEHWPLISLVRGIGDSKLGYWPSISLVVDIGDGGLRHWPLISRVGDIGNGGLEHWPSIALVGDVGEGGLGH
ncbi:hypothetical protein PoB_001731800 [Plakobranchus ocellatus]|uniref:Uncharacterized protein n=1 Tax=Plakobranchus ocellatus TaxID=259542 RepID=A0AAV3Z7V6_9GAST|nr:hypothetical protein PoB_001731800 [Plakobranchus ocellatus]